ncbi:MAG: protein CapI [Rhodospirillaceae bacterium]|nr:protein CapI [Rhodospirillaceae bacterium]
MTVLVTGAAGFIGYHVCKALLARGESVVGIDSLNSYYAVSLKKDRLAQLEPESGFQFHHVDIADEPAMRSLFQTHRFRRVVHLAAQAGVRYSIDHPMDYAHSNLVGHLVMLEMCRSVDGFEHLVYASSSSVYGGNTSLPFSLSDRTDNPVSLYAATKRSNELMSFTYSHLYGIPATGLRFFTVYGPWGRPDMAVFLFTQAILNSKPIKVFNNGDMKRDFTFIDDIVAGVVAILDGPPAATAGAPHALYNIGNNRSEPLLKFIAVLEQAIGREAVKTMEPMQPGDVKETYADIEDIRRDFGYEPSTPIEVGLPKFVAWYRGYYGV